MADALLHFLPIFSYSEQGNVLPYGFFGRQRRKKKKKAFQKRFRNTRQSNPVRKKKKQHSALPDGETSVEDGDYDYDEIAQTITTTSVIPYLWPKFPNLTDLFNYQSTPSATTLSIPPRVKLVKSVKLGTETTKLGTNGAVRV